MSQPQHETQDDDERVPIFGTWPRIYTAVLVTQALVMGLIALFSAWAW